ncbi:MAG: DNA integrity scanning protein DisA nucleotide-binding domain protein [Euryarchaeota archaeon]|nr:DNA integrity scanning protein DisA nucleotide-binding domain protein [Euryarchaeota archaeon]
MTKTKASTTRSRVPSGPITDFIHDSKATVTLLVTDVETFARSVIASSKAPVILATSKEKLARTFESKVRATMLTTEDITGSVSGLGQVRDVITTAYLEGRLDGKDDALVIAGGGGVESLIRVNLARDTEVVKVKQELSGRGNLKVMERLLRLSSELAREGREGKRTGAMFVIGDAPAVMSRSRQIVINPFMGHPESERNLLNDSAWETAKEFSQLDGAFILREDGVMEAAGRYIEIDKGVHLQSGLGGRHLAAASISGRTKAIAVTVSSSGTIRIWKDGAAIITMGRV